LAEIRELNKKLDSFYDKIPKEVYLTLKEYPEGANIVVDLLSKSEALHQANPKKQDIDIVFIEAANLRFMTWSILTILELTPNLPWEKFTEYLEKENKNKGQKNNNELHDIMTFYYLDKLEILREKNMKDKNWEIAKKYLENKYWEIAKKYLEKNVFKEVYLGEKPPEQETILDSITKSIKRNDQRLRTTKIIDGTGYPTEEELSKIDLDTLNKMFNISKMNDIHNLIEKINNKKLNEAKNHLTKKQQAVINLRYNDDLTYEKNS